MHQPHVLGLSPPQESYVSSELQMDNIGTLNYEWITSSNVHELTSMEWSHTY